VPIIGDFISVPELTLVKIFEASSDLVKLIGDVFI